MRLQAGAPDGFRLFEEVENSQIDERPVMNSADGSMGLPKETASNHAAPLSAAAPVDPLAVARQRVRDGWLFALLSALTLVAAVCLFNGSIGFGVEDERHTAFVVASSAMAVFFVLTTWQFVRARWAGLKTRSLAAGLWLITLCDIFLMVCFVILVDCRREDLRFPVLAVIPALGLAWVLGVRLAGWRRMEVASRRRKMAFISVLAILFLVGSIPMAGMIGVLFNHPIQSMRPWPSYLPEWVRSPVAFVTVKVWPNSRYQWVNMGTAPIWLLRQEAPLAWGRDAWHWWAFREPEEALAEALAITTTPSPLTPSTTYDNIAGYIIGKLGSEKEILERVKGPYSNELKNGIHDGIEGIESGSDLHKHRDGIGYREVSREVAEALTDHLMSDPTKYPRQVFLPLRQYPDLGRKLLAHWLKQPYRSSGIRFHLLQNLWVCMDEDNGMLFEALSSPNFKLRGAALYQTQRRFMCSYAKLPAPIVAKLLEIAEGRRADVYPDEREYAAEILLSNIRGGMPEFRFQNVAPLGPNAVPLTKSRERSIQETCRKAREKLESQGGGTNASRDSR